MSKFVRRTDTAVYCRRPAEDLGADELEVMARIKRAYGRSCSVLVILAGVASGRRYRAVLQDGSFAGYELHSDAESTPMAALSLLLQDDVPGWSTAIGHMAMVEKSRAVTAQTEVPALLN